MRARILLIDDDQSFCELLTEALEPLGYTTTWRLQGEQALELLAEEDFDVAVVDMNLGLGMTGVESCARMREQRPGMPVLMITGFGDMAAAQAAVRAGARDFITKPVELPVLEQAIERTRNDERARTERLREQLSRNSQRQPVESAGADPVGPEHVMTLEQAERHQVELTLRRCNGNKTRAAVELGIDRRTLYRKLERWAEAGSSTRSSTPVEGGAPLGAETPEAAE